MDWRFLIRLLKSGFAEFIRVLNINNNFIIYCKFYFYYIMNNYNSSNYYRANPYKDIGYMPPIAQKNRQTSGYGT